MSSFCELCGKPIQIPKSIVIDESIFNVCLSCSKHGKPYQVNQSHTKISSLKKNTTPVYSYHKNRPTTYSNKIQIVDETVLKSDFAKLIRDARIKKGYTQEYAANKLNEKILLFKKIEAGHIKPDEILTKKLERFFGISLYQILTENKDEKNDL